MHETGSLSYVVIPSYFKHLSGPRPSLAQPTYSCSVLTKISIILIDGDRSKDDLRTTSTSSERCLFDIEIIDIIYPLHFPPLSLQHATYPSENRKKRRNKASNLRARRSASIASPASSSTPPPTGNADTHRDGEAGVYGTITIESRRRAIVPSSANVHQSSS